MGFKACEHAGGGGSIRLCGAESRAPLCEPGEAGNVVTMRAWSQPAIQHFGQHIGNARRLAHG